MRAREARRYNVTQVVGPDRELGIAYLFHMLFGWGAGGGSPLGLLLVLAFVAWLVMRRRRRDMRWDRGY